LCFTAEGKFDLFFEPQLKPWDVAAGALILESAGGLVSDFSGGTDWLYGKSLIGGNPHMHKAFLNFMKTI
jgi:myo-inositol-1(or 4)-monophosphatase